MEAPRTLGRTATGEVCEVTAPESVAILIGRGQTLVDQDPVAKKIQAYLASQAGTAATTAADTATHEDTAPESKAVEQDDTENKGVSFPPPTRRLGSRGP